jgi:hypothetical protein
MAEELTPLGQVPEEPPDDIDVKEEGERDFSPEEDLEVLGGGVGGACRLEDNGGEGEEDPDPFGAVVPSFDEALACGGASVEDAVLVVSGYQPKFVHRHPRKEYIVLKNVEHVKELRIGTYGAAPNALFFVSFLMAENVLVMTATNRLMSQKLRMMMPKMKKKHETKNSASIMLYITGAHYNRRRHKHTQKKAIS